MKKSEALLLDLYELTMAQAYFKGKPNASATFDLFAIWEKKGVKFATTKLALGELSKQIK